MSAELRQFLHFSSSFEIKILHDIFIQTSIPRFLRGNIKGTIKVPSSFPWKYQQNSDNSSFPPLFFVFSNKKSLMIYSYKHQFLDSSGEISKVPLRYHLCSLRNISRIKTIPHFLHFFSSFQIKIIDDIFIQTSIPRFLRGNIKGTIKVPPSFPWKCQQN
jgi:hypothetical protein